MLYFGVYSNQRSNLWSEYHCKLAKMFVTECPTHNLHLVLGILSFIIAFVISQFNYLKTVF
jgi:hypothetical protein